MQFLKLTILCSLDLAYSQCTTTTTTQSYCLSGLNIYEDTNLFLAAQYIYQGIFNSCSYFKSVDELYLFWSITYSNWAIYEELDDNFARAICSQPNLDDCVQDEWYFTDGMQWYIHSNAQINSCDYDNIQCLASYNIYDSYCIQDTQYDITFTYLFEGCYMNEPYFVLNHSSGNQTLLWDDMLSIW
eukprot:14107_1